MTPDDYRAMTALAESEEHGGDKDEHVRGHGHDHDHDHGHAHD
jgi:hypothetical protein